jgi:hypothetical protein
LTISPAVKLPLFESSRPVSSDAACCRLLTPFTAGAEIF